MSAESHQPEAVPPEADPSAASVRTHVILDGLQDPAHARELSARWAAMGYRNAVDPAAQSAWLQPMADTDADGPKPGPDAKPTPEPESDPDREPDREPDRKPEETHTTPSLTEADLPPITDLARGFGIELRERVGEAFKPGNDPAAMRERITREYRQAIGQGIAFGLPVIILHYLAPVLAQGGGQLISSMAFPWLFELLMTGWLLRVTVWPILWQGGLSLMHLRLTGDMLTSVALLLAFFPSAYGVLSLLWSETPWFGDAGPMFPAVVVVAMTAAVQRYASHRMADRLSGHTPSLIMHYGKLIQVWLLVGVIVFFLRDLRWAVAVLMLLPPMMSLGAVNRYSPGPTAALPVVAFALFLLLGRGVAAKLGLMLDEVVLEVAMGFSVLMTVVLCMGWRGVARGEVPSGGA